MDVVSDAMERDVTIKKPVLKNIKRSTELRDAS